MSKNQSSAPIAENKMGTMPVGKLVFNMSLPMMISMLVQALYNIVDSIFVAKLSENALTAVSLAFPLQTLLIAVATGTGVGAVLISKVKEGLMSTLRSKIGALLIKPALKSTLKSFDASEYGGAPLLGLNGLVVKTHGSSKAKEVSNTLIQCVTFKKQKINEKIKESIQSEQKSAE